MPIDLTVELGRLRSRLYDVASPAQLTANQNDYNPSSLNLWRLTSDAARTITGIANGVEGRALVVINVGANNIVLANQSASSAAANRIITATGADVTLAADDSAMLIYDNTSARWRLVNSHG